jgi:hypothetical protein
MTWVIGMTGFLEQGVLVGDTRITLHDPSGRQPDRGFDGVQKVHAVSSNIAIGFAGNIDSAMTMVGDARRNLAAVVPAGHALEQPSRFLLHWRRRLRWAWQNRLDERGRAGGLSLFYIGALPPHGTLGMTPTAGWIVRSPDFEPERVPARVARSIGSGTHVTEYAAELERLSGEYGELLRWEMGPWPELGGAAMPITLAISEVIEEHSEPGISPHLVVCSVRWSGVQIGTNDRVGLSPNAPSREMPPIARNWAEWQALKAEHGLADLLALA